MSNQNNNAEQDQFLCPMVPSPEDQRDLIFEKLGQPRARAANSNKLTLLEELDLREDLNPPRNQGKRGTCGAFSAACIKEYHERRDVNFHDYMSPESIYFYRASQDQNGMYARNIMKILQKQGIAPENYFPYQKENPEEIPDLAQAVMKNFQISHYAKVTTVQGVKEALNNQGPLLVCVPVYSNFPEIWKPKQEGDKRRGGHAMVIVGYNQEGFIIRNSWGDTWNGDGYVIFPYEDFGMQWEIWSSIDAETDINQLSEDLQFQNCGCCAFRLKRFLTWIRKKLIRKD